MEEKRSKAQPEGEPVAERPIGYITPLDMARVSSMEPSVPSVNIWAEPDDGDLPLYLHPKPSREQGEMCGPHGVCEFAVVGAANHPQASLGDLALDRDDAPKGSVVEYQIKCQVCHRDGFLLLNQAPPSREREAALSIVAQAIMAAYTSHHLPDEFKSLGKRASEALAILAGKEADDGKE